MTGHRVARWAAPVLLVAAVTSSASCGAGSSWPDDAAAYLPDDVGGVEVDTGSTFATSIAESLTAGGSVEAVSAAAGRPSEVDPAPAYVLLVFSGNDGDLVGVERRFAEDLVGGVAPAERSRAHDVDVDAGTFAQGDRRVAYAVARPSAGVAVVALAFAEDADAGDAVRRLLDEAAADG